MNHSPESHLHPSPYKELLNACDELTSLSGAHDIQPATFELDGMTPLGKETRFSLLGEANTDEAVVVRWFNEHGREQTTDLFDTEHPVLGLVSFSKSNEAIDFSGEILILDNGELEVMYEAKIEDEDAIPEVDGFAEALGLDQIWDEASGPYEVLNVMDENALLNPSRIPILVETLTWALRNLQIRDE